jgi:hypothetical protein
VQEHGDAVGDHILTLPRDHGECLVHDKAEWVSAALVTAWRQRKRRRRWRLNTSSPPWCVVLDRGVLAPPLLKLLNRTCEDKQCLAFIEC